MKTYRIAVIAGDGIGKEVIPAGMSVLNMAAEQGNFRCEFTELPWGCDYYLQTGRMMDEDGLSRVKAFDAIRELYASTAVARVHGWKPGYFSFNVPGGRCEACQGEGTVKV